MQLFNLHTRHQVFREFDTDGNGQLDIDELGRAVVKLGVDVEDDLVDVLMVCGVYVEVVVSRG